MIWVCAAVCGVVPIMFCLAAILIWVGKDE